MRKNQALIIFGNFVYLAAQWALTIVVVRVTDDEFYMAGLLGLALTVTNIFYIISCYGMRSYQVSDVNNLFSNQSYSLSRVITTVIAMVACIVYSIIHGYHSDALLVIVLYMLFKCFEAGSDVIYGFFQVHDAYDKLCISMCVKGMISLLVFSILLTIGLSINYALAGMCIVAFLTFAMLDVRWAKKIVSPLVIFSKEKFKESFKLLYSSFPMVILLITQPLLMSIPRLYFEDHFSTEDLGVYSSLSSPTVVITTFVSCAMMPYIPLFAEYSFNKDRKRLYKLTFGSILFTTLFGVVSFIFGGLLGDWALTILYGPSIRGHVDVFQLIIIVSTLSSITMCLNSLFIAMRKLISLSVVLLLGCGVCYAITPWIVDNYAMRGVTYSLMLSQSFQIFFAIVLAIIFIQRMTRKLELDK